ncbi:hypothetical protein [Vulgatibacter incomptus]|uniref:Uncharacterized protein n=1 Tax=Vulgatibacter incomptus TaxID=1391653 RepID=A0A0K1PHQ2_9BACT|nr:hypothetical protein [Vulgatibacter incomptus]AKU92639.1 hypothetical protein AKJ08_3026 [Vulgatibacter incomptus]
MVETAEVIRQVLARGDGLDPWLSFPQRASCFGFGPNKSAIPIGALRLLWAAGWPWSQPCPSCRGTLHAISFGGLLSAGGAKSVCTGCARSFFQQIGGLGTMADLVRASPLMGTEFQPTGMTFGGATTSDGAALRSALGMAAPLPGAGKSEVFNCVVSAQGADSSQLNELQLSDGDK